MTSGSATRAARAHQALQQEARQSTRRRRITGLSWGIGLLFVIGIVGAALWASQPQQASAVRQAPDFTMTDTNGTTHSLADYRGKNLVLYFSEGAGCQSCLVQMGEIEKMADQFADANITVLPIVMNTKEQILADMAANGVTTPFLLDDGGASTAYGTIGKGMHAGLPGHSFVVIDAKGMQRWYGEYPSMWLVPGELLSKAKEALAE